MNDEEESVDRRSSTAGRSTLRVGNAGILLRSVVLFRGGDTLFIMILSRAFTCGTVLLGLERDEEVEKGKERKEGKAQVCASRLH
jgi:hypothetical protein